MSQSNSLHKVENHVFKLATFEDGIWEIYLGLFFAMMSVHSITRNYFGPVVNAMLVLGVLVVLVGLAWLINKNHVRPRIGLVKFGAGMKKKVRISRGFLMLLVLVTLLLVVVASQGLLKESGWNNLPKWVRDFDVDLIFAIVIIILFSAIAYQLDLPRFYLYGILLGVGNFSSTVMLVYHGKLFQWPLAIAGGIILLSGISVFIRFNEKCPRPKEAANG